MSSEFVDMADLKIGMFVEIELGWMAHPFPTSSFKISTTKQVEVIRTLGLKRVRFVPAKSDPQFNPAMQAAAAAAVSASALLGLTSVGHDAQERDAAFEAQKEQRRQHSALLNAQTLSLAACEKRFGQALQQYKQSISRVATDPKAATQQCMQLIASFTDDMIADGESAIRLLSDGMGDRANMHPVNVTVVSLLLGKAMAMSRDELVDLGMAAFLHDAGKSQLPDRVRWLDDNFSTAEYKMYQDHVARGVDLGRQMGLSPGSLLAIAQHHEMIDGSGFPAKTKGEKMSRPAKVLALINRYENLCNPSRPAAAMTPHEALSLIFAQLKARFDGSVLSAFIRMMGVYPPGSIVQLVDERYAMVVAANSSRPLKPRVFVHDRDIPKHEALILDLENTPSVGIRRSVKPVNLPVESYEYLSPRQRIGYFFESASGPAPLEPQG